MQHPGLKFKGEDEQYARDDLHLSSPPNLTLDVLDLAGEGWQAAQIRGPARHVVRFQASRRDVADAAADSTVPGQGRPTGGSAEWAQEILPHLGPLHRTGAGSMILRCQSLSQQKDM